MANFTENHDTHNDKSVEEKATDYVAKARQEIHDWQHPDSGILDKAFATLTMPIDKAGEALMNAPQFGDALKQSTEKTILTLSDAANWTLDVQDTIEAYRNSAENDGANIKKLEDIADLPIETIDKQVKLFKSKYVALTSAQGVTTGMVGWAGIPADVVGLITANLRAIGEYATYYGFDMSAKSEQVFAMSLLGIATSHSAKERQAALDDTFDIVQSSVVESDLLKGDSLKSEGKEAETLALNQINEEVMSRLLRQTATKVATNLVKTKAAQIIPALGAVVAGGVNASYTSSVCEAAYQCYRQRFLDRQKV